MTLIDCGLGKFWANADRKQVKVLKFQVENCSARCIDIAGVASSILATPTIFPRQNNPFAGLS